MKIRYKGDKPLPMYDGDKKSYMLRKGDLIEVSKGVAEDLLKSADWEMLKEFLVKNNKMYSKNAKFKSKA